MYGQIYAAQPYASFWAQATAAATGTLSLFTGLFGRVFNGVIN